MKYITNILDIDTIAIETDATSEHIVTNDLIEDSCICDGDGNLMLSNGIVVMCPICSINRIYVIDMEVT